MPISIRKYLPYLYLLLLSVPLYLISISDVHPWGDDFAQYVKEAQNIAHGRPYYESNYVFNKYNTVYAPPQYPPVFPILLSPVVKFWGLSFRAMFYFNSVVLTCLLLALYAFFRKYMGTVAAICLALMVCYSGIIIDLKKNVLADLPCLLFVTLYLWYRNAALFTWQRIALLIFFAVMAIQIRSQAVFLLPAEIGLLALTFAITSIKAKKLALKEMLASPSLYIVPGVFLVNLILNKVVFASPLSTTEFYNNFIHEALKDGLTKIALEYMNYVPNTISTFFHYNTYNSYTKALALLFTGAGLIFTVAGFFISVYRKLKVDDLFFAIMCGVILFYPVRDPRYFLPVIPIVYYYCFTTFSALAGTILKVPGSALAIVATTLYLATGYEYLRKSATEVTPGCVPEAKDKTAIDYISTHVNDRDIIVFTKPRMLTLFTNKRSINSSWQMSHEDNKKIFDSMQVKYMLVLDGLDDAYFKTYLHEVQHPVDSVHIAEGYTLYSLR